MIVIGLLSTEEEAQEIQFIAKICSVENRIHYLVHVDKIKTLVRQQNGNTSKKGVNTPQDYNKISTFR